MADIAIRDMSGKIWRGPVVNRPGAHSVTIDYGGGWITAPTSFIIEGDGMDDLHDHRAETTGLEILRLTARVEALEAERDALLGVVAMQMEAISAPVSPTGDKAGPWLETLRRLLTYWGEDWHRTPHWRPMLKLDGPISKIVAHIDRGW